MCLPSMGQGGGPRVVVSTAAFHARVRGSVPGLGGLKETKLFLPHPRVKVSIVGDLRDREVACSASDRQGSNFESCVWRTVSSQSSHHPQEVLLAQFSLYVHKGGLKPDSFHLSMGHQHTTLRVGVLHCRDNMGLIKAILIINAAGFSGKTRQGRKLTVRLSCSHSWCLPNAGLMLGQRLRHWLNFKPASGNVCCLLRLCARHVNLSFC